jgi:Zn-dependent M16 (insulinase) family peptidase
MQSLRRKPKDIHSIDYNFPLKSHPGITINEHGGITMKIKGRFSIRKRFLVFVTFFFLYGVVSAKSIHLAGLSPDQPLAGFKVLNLYENHSGNIMGARFISERYGFLIDLLQMESVPQAYLWVKTPVTNDKGLPHITEHLLLARGKKGRFTANQRYMALAICGAWSYTTETSYTFATSAGIDTFYSFFQSNLDALLNPEITDEECIREAFHLTVNRDPTGRCTLDEAGTIHNEMVSVFDNASAHIWWPLTRMIYGSDHPLSSVFGGRPSAVRMVTIEDIRAFHASHYHLSNMGAMISISPDIDPETFLTRLHTIMASCQSEPDTTDSIGISAVDIPAGKPACPEGSVQLLEFPSDNRDGPGEIWFAWPANPSFDTASSTDRILLDLFLYAFAGNDTSILYDRLINPERRRLDTGAATVSGFCDPNPGHVVFMGLTGVNSTYLRKEHIQEVRKFIKREIESIAQLPADSQELRQFNKQVLSRLTQLRRDKENLLNSPPMFSNLNNTAMTWMAHMKFLEQTTEYRKSLTLRGILDRIESILRAGNSRNIWGDTIDQWNLLKSEPYAVGASPSPDFRLRRTKDKEERIAAYHANLLSRYHKNSVQEALAAYKHEFDENSDKLEVLAGKDVLPSFTNDPPLTYDDSLKYSRSTLPCDTDFITTTFNNMTSATFGAALRLDLIPEDFLVYVPLLPLVMTEIGVVKDNHIVPYDEMHRCLQHEILDLDAYFSVNGRTNRIECVLRGKASNREEIPAVLDWMTACLSQPYLEKANTPRITTLIERTLDNLTKDITQKEAAVSHALAILYQANPLYLTTSCFLTQAHHYHRLKWLFTDPGTGADRMELNRALETLRTKGLNKTKEDLLELLDGKPPNNISNQNRDILAEVNSSLKSALIQSSDAAVANEWEYLCDELSTDLMTPPVIAFEHLKSILASILTPGNMRLFMISNTKNRESSMDLITEFTGLLSGKSKPTRQKYSTGLRIFDRIGKSETDHPVYMGLVNETVRNGAMCFLTPMANSFDTSEDALLDYLAINLLSGGGAHSLFMKTWEAGLAYSSGINYWKNSGHACYAANRCPDIAKTIRFIRTTLQSVKLNPDWLDYAIAQEFNGARPTLTYERRGEIMAADITDGMTPEFICRYRKSYLELRDKPNLFKTLSERMKRVYGSVIPGFDSESSSYSTGIRFIFGPESQFSSLESYLTETDTDQTIVRLFPADFWVRKIHMPAKDKNLQK